MAQRIQTLFIDDIDGGDAEGTVRFALDGTEYEIDLNTDHSEALRNTLDTYIAHARKVSSTPAPRPRASGKRIRPVDNTKVREWARVQGIKINNRGRIPADVLEKFNDAQALGGTSGLSLAYA